ncbi:MAG: DUF3570 domain-containing protein [Verrucomicrobiaceae bacterium]|nr:DUF3570 domain-containing protein [Verrucomicrobiaceae bacterium]
MSKLHLSLTLAVILWVSPLRASEERIDLTLGYYLEDHNRVEVWSPVLNWETPLTTTSLIRLQAVYDVVSGASPTGAPPTKPVREVTKTITSTETYNAVSGPSGRSRRATRKVTNKETVLEEYGEPILPLQQFEDARLGVNLEWESRAIDNWVFTPSAAYSTEQDYESLTGAIKVGREFNDKATLLSAALSFTSDSVLVRWDDEWKDKDTTDGIIGITQVINPTTLLNASFTAGRSTGYLSDQYKSAMVDGEVIPEVRPDARTRWVGMITLNKMFTPVDGSIEASYRYYKDTFGVSANTYALTWFQNVGKSWVIAPSFRYYEQSEADFYAPAFEGNPQYFSADYRLSKLRSMTCGLKVVWKPSSKVQVSAAYDRYIMEGRDGGRTSADAYPSANIFTVGIKLWY